MVVCWNDGCYHHVKSDNELLIHVFVYIHLVFFIVMYVNMYRKAVIVYYDSVMVTRCRINFAFYRNICLEHLFHLSFDLHLYFMFHKDDYSVELR